MTFNDEGAAILVFIITTVMVTVFLCMRWYELLHPEDDSDDSADNA